ncbi:MAG: patatin-like phospholipase family protein [Fervidobacterium sp.]|uniref:patatin-like phospholipase family protein n=1 Tax=Fervidobacterium sp. TaxID=1871331 RepID=UPI004049ABA7
MLGIALQAGGVKGFSHIATLKVFEECSVVPDIISGSSAGSIVGGLYAVHQDAEAVYSVFSKTVKKFLRKQKTKPEPIMNFEMTIKESLYSVDEYYEFFKELFGKTKFSELKTKLLVIAFDLSEMKSITIDEGFLVDAVLASCTVPGVFEPTHLAGSKMLDGGVLSPVPAKELKDCGVDKVVASIFDEEIPTYKTYADLMLAVDWLKERAIVNKELDYYVDFCFRYPISVSWKDFDKCEKVYSDALKIARGVKDEFQDFIGR